MLATFEVTEVVLAVVVLIATSVLFSLVSKRVFSRRGMSSPFDRASTAAGKDSAKGAPVLVVYATTRGRSRELARRLVAALEKAHLATELVDASAATVDPWDELLNGEAKDCAVLVSTAHGGTCPEPARPVLEETLNDLTHDFRIGRGGLKGRRFASLGLGSSAYDPPLFCAPAKRCEKMLRTLGAARVASAYLDDAAPDCGDAEYAMWERRVVAAFLAKRQTVFKDGSTSTKSPKKRGTVVEDEGSLLLSDDDDGGGEEASDEPEKNSGVLDVEDLGGALVSSSSKTGGAAAAANEGGPRAMVTASQAKSLKKEGYKLIGTHSAVKLCRWTKHQLRGRGGCYKHTFYGISSYQCMEATPSLACANKCTFCWRHHKNPVGKEWTWKTDPPAEIVKAAIDLHVKMIHECKGVPGVIADRWAEAHTVRHCALSLVGEPIMYPHINALIDELHARRISTFLVTNAQFPDAIRTLRPVTQLYVSVDAPTRHALEEVDRPLFQDAWERLRESLKLLKEKKQRTVARLTLVKGHNDDDLAGYAELIALGTPTMIELKGVTFCGTSDASDLTMENCPWHHEIVAFAEALTELVNARTSCKYAIACSHKHSVCVLVARVDELALLDESNDIVGWKTWIDYDTFHAKTQSGQPFTVADYATPTPNWALHGAPEDGFDPSDTRLYKKKANGKSA